MAYSKLKHESGCSAATKRIGRSWPPLSGSTVPSGPRTPTSLAPVSQRGPQTASRSACVLRSIPLSHRTNDHGFDSTFFHNTSLLPFASGAPSCCNVSVTMTDYAQPSDSQPVRDFMDNQDTATPKGIRPEAGKTTLPQPGRPVPSRAYPGALIVVEGTDGSGKSTQLYLLKRWLEIGGYRLHFTEWNSSPLVKSATRRGKQRRLLTPTTFSLLHAADFADRCERQIMPLLQGDYLVLADRYIYTAFARDAARGCP